MRSSEHSVLHTAVREGPVCGMRLAKRIFWRVSRPLLLLVISDAWIAIVINLADTYHEHALTHFL